MITDSEKIKALQNKVYRYSPDARLLMLGFLMGWMENTTEKHKPDFWRGVESFYENNAPDREAQA